MYCHMLYLCEFGLTKTTFESSSMSAGNVSSDRPTDLQCATLLSIEIVEKRVELGTYVFKLFEHCTTRSCYDMIYR